LNTENPRVAGSIPALGTIKFGQLDYRAGATHSAFTGGVKPGTASVADWGYDK